MQRGRRPRTFQWEKAQMTANGREENDGERGEVEEGGAASLGFLL